MNNFAILIARVLKKRTAGFSKFASGVEKHIIHMFSEEKSKVVCIWIDWFHIIFKPFISNTGSLGNSKEIMKT